MYRRCATWPNKLLSYHLSDVFTDRAFGGNPLAVFPNAGELSAEQMQTIAGELNISESVFVLPAQNPAYAHRIRIFTPRMELPFAGHPTVGTACTLLRLGRIQEGSSILEEAVGPITVHARKRDDRYFAEFTATQKVDVRDDVPSRDILADVLSIDGSDILYDHLKPLAVSAGVPFLFVPVRNRNVLAQIQINQSAWHKSIAGSWAPHFYVITEDAELEGSGIRARMFAPAMGISEDPATGGAATALPAYLDVASNSRTRTQVELRVEQGFEMGRPSLIDVTVVREGDQITAVRVGGETVFIGSGELF